MAQRGLLLEEGPQQSQAGGRGERTLEGSQSTNQPSRLQARQPGRNLSLKCDSAGHTSV